MVIFSTLTIFEVKIDMSVFTNIIIAAATVIATLIHFDSQKKQRIDRIWEMNKGVLLDLTHSLSEAIEATETEIHNRHCHPAEVVSLKNHDWNKLKEKANYVLNVYGPLINAELLSSINHHKQMNSNIHLQVDHDEIDTLTAYEIMLKEHKKLYDELLSFISKISGVSAT
jgi:hypothetical protein